MGNLYVVATPIGNLEDITLRALRILREVDAIACEDTRHTGKLLAHFEIKKPLIRCDEHARDSQISKIIKYLEEGKNVAFVSDAGTPGISDPGAKIIAEAVKNDINIIPIPGVSALTTLLSVTGLKNNKILFLGFLPKKKGRKTFFSKIKKILEILPQTSIVIYESPYRIMKTLKEFEKENNFDIIVGRELTKKFEEILRGDIKSVIKYFSKNSKKIKGEFSICLTKQELK